MYRIIIADENERFIDLDLPELNIRSIYQISNYGTVVNKITGKTIKPHFNSCGYLRVTLMIDNGKCKKFSVHRLVAMMFIPNIENKPEVNHITEKCKTFNYYKNLEWSTASENQKHHYAYGDSSNQRKGNKTNHYKGEDRYNANVNEKLVRKICKMLEKDKSVIKIRNKLLPECDLTEKQLYALIYHLLNRNSWPHVTKDYKY